MHQINWHGFNISQRPIARVFVKNCFYKYCAKVGNLLCTKVSMCIIRYLWSQNTALYMQQTLCQNTDLKWSNSFRSAWGLGPRAWTIKIFTIISTDFCCGLYHKCVMTVSYVSCWGFTARDVNCDHQVLL